MTSADTVNPKKAAGILAQKNRKELAQACGKYLLACRMASVSEIKQTVLTKPGRYTVIKDNLHAKEVIVGDGERRRRYILCYNPKEAKRQKKIRGKSQFDSCYIHWYE